MIFKTPQELVEFIDSLDLESLCVDSISLKFNREKWLKKAMADGKTIIGRNVEGESFWDEYTVNNANDKTKEEMKSGMEKWFKEV